MKTVWKYSLKTETLRLIHCAHQIVVGFYKTNNFIVLPNNPGVANANIVTFPHLSYAKVPRFWEEVKKVDVHDLPTKCNQKTFEATADLLLNSNILKPDFTKTQRLWRKAEKDIIDEIYKVLPGKKGLIKKITIYPTFFGTSVSFSWINPKGELIIYLREDQGIHTITEAVITSLTRLDIYEKLEGLWQESEIITDFLITETSIGKILQKYENAQKYIPTLKGVRTKEQARLLQDSEEFYKKLGIPSFDKPFGLNGYVPEINKKPLENLSPNERLILRMLIKKAGMVATFDELGSELFKGEDKFSLYAISKTIERLRNKLEANGISGSYIQTLRGQGYILNN
jgi:hypothetical protein